MESGGGARSGGASLRLTAVYSKNRYASRFHALAAVADSCLSTRLADSQEPGAPTLYACCHAMQLQFLAWPPSCPPIHSPSSPGLGPPLPLLPFYSATSATRYTLQAQIRQVDLSGLPEFPPFDKRREQEHADFARNESCFGMRKFYNTIITFVRHTCQGAQEVAPNLGHVRGEVATVTDGRGKRPARLTELIVKSSTRKLMHRYGNKRRIPLWNRRQCLKAS